MARSERVRMVPAAAWGVNEIIAIAAPLLSALGIRQAVYSPATVDKLTEPAPTTYQKGTL